MRKIEPLHWLLGYVDIRAENGFPERFINICTGENIPLWNMRKSGNVIYARTTLNGFKKIRLPAKKSSMRVRMVRKCGLPFALNYILCRTGLAAGLAVAAVLLAFLSGRIWVIDADIEDPYLAEQVVQAYADAGLKVGVSKRSDWNCMRTAVTQKLEDISWTTVNITGCIATVKVRYMSKPEEADIGSAPSNIIALKDGQVEIAEAYKGACAVKCGDTAVKGDLLVSGMKTDSNGIAIITPSEGYIAASTVIECETQTAVEKTVLTENAKKLYSLYFLGKELPSRENKENEYCYCHEERLYVGGKKMPFGICYRRYSDFTAKKITVSQKENLLTAINDHSLECYNKTLHAQIKNQTVSIDCNEDCTVIRSTVFCYENIGTEVPILIDESEQVEDDQLSD